MLAVLLPRTETAYNSQQQIKELPHKDSVQTVALLALLDELQANDYDHLCPTPETQRWSISKRQKRCKEDVLLAKTFQDIWGWSLPVCRNVLASMHSKKVVDLLVSAGVLQPDSSNSALLRPQIRVSGLYPFGKAPNYYIHSSWPTCSSDAVFFGPESYRFTRYMACHTQRIPNCHLAIDVCSGAGVGAFHLARSFPAAHILGLDINPKAIQIAKVNAKHLFPNRPSYAPIDMIVSDGFLALADSIKGQVDLVSINPPFIAGDKRTYAAGGPTGMELLLRLVGEAREVLKMGGELWGHMAAPVSFSGTDTFREALNKLDGWEVSAYDILDVDIFGDEMECPENYPDIARLASVGLVLTKVASST